MRRRAFTLVELLVVMMMFVGLFVCLLGMTEPIFLLFGWIIYPFKIVPQISAEPVALAVGGGALVLLLVFVHGLARFFWRGAQQSDDAARWRFRWTLRGVFLALFAVGAGIGLLALVHEVNWLLHPEKPLHYPGGSSMAARRAQSNNNLRQFALACDVYHDKHRRLPPAGTFDRRGEPLHSWETHLLPHLENPARPDLTVPWTHPANKAPMATPVQVFWNPGFRHSRLDERGYALSYYAANAHVMWNNGGIRFEDATDGRSNTLLFGEVAEGFRPWGDPVNSRDPAVGINRPGGFGGPPGQAGAQFAMLDGSVRFIAEDTDPEVLRALATPAGNDDELAKRGLR